MPPQVQQLLAPFINEYRGVDEYVLSSQFGPGNKPFSTWSRYTNRIRALSGSAVNLHDFRRLFATQTLDAGVPKAITRAVMGHKSGTSLDDVYTHSQQLEEKRKALTAYADWIDACR